MAATPSRMLALGTRAPAFELAEPRTGRHVRSDDLSGPLLVMFICNHCPYVQHVRAELARIGVDYGTRVSVVGIMSNDVDHYPDDHPDRMVEEAETYGYTFPYLYDEAQDVAKAFGAACTPDFFLFDADRSLVYRGQLDESRPSNGIPVTGEDLRRALDAVVAGGEVPVDQQPSLGCSIKWRPGNEPV
ncbi:MAG: thioredoxin family protein [Acidimicrobiia bacterium]|nr:thioredoxin family protein [Acidimicrobiia bacterium]